MKDSLKYNQTKSLPGSTCRRNKRLIKSFMVQLIENNFYRYFYLVQLVNTNKDYLKNN